MKKMIINLVLLVSFNLTVISQPPETIYQGNLIATGFRQSIPLASDGPFNMGFTFTYFGNTYTQFYVSANGLVIFEDPTASYNTEVTIPDAASPNNYIAPFWDNLSILDGGNVMYQTIGSIGNRKCIIQFKNMGFDPVPVPFGTFTVILYETSNKIQLQYRLLVNPYSTDSHGGNATIGLENATGSDGVLYSFHSNSSINKEDAISFTPSGSTYTTDDNAIYDGVFLVSAISQPDAGIVDLISPAADAVIGGSHTFEWGAASNATSYTLLVDVSPDMSTAKVYNAGTNLTYDTTGLSLDQTYYWTVLSYNGTILTWGEVSRFSTSSAPPLTAVPREIWVAQGSERLMKLQYSGGDASVKSAVVTSLPTQGELWQVSGGVKGTQINTIPATVIGSEFSLIYVASSISGNDAGNFNFKFHDDSGDSPQATFTINVSPAGIPNLLSTSRSSGIELQFDRSMNDPAGKHAEFSASVDGSPVTVTSAALKTNDAFSIFLTLATPLTGSETVLVSYTKGTVSATTGGILESFTDQPVTLLSQTITFSTNLNKIYGNSPFSLASSSTSGLTSFTYSSSNPSVASIAGTLLSILAAGTSFVTSYQAGNATYAPARNTRILTVSKADQTITFEALPPKVTGDPDFSPGATSSSGLTVSYSSNNASVATIAGAMIHIVGPGNAIITAVQSGNSNYNAAADVPQDLSVSVATAIDNPLSPENIFKIYYLNSLINIQTIADEWSNREGSIRVFDMSGNLFTDLRKINFNKDSLIQLPISGPAGLYVLEIRSGLKRFTWKVMVLRN